MATISDIIRAFITSVGDPKEPAKLILQDLWDAVLLPQETEALLLDAIYESLIEEAKTSDGVWSKEELRKILKYKVDLGTLQLADLSNQEKETEFTKKLTKAFEDVALVPDRIYTKWDFEHISRNIIVRAKAGFIKKISNAENSPVFRKLLLQHSVNQAVDLGKLVSLLSAYFPDLKNDLEKILRSSDDVTEGIHTLKGEIKKVQDFLTNNCTDIQARGKLDSLSKSEINSLKRQLANYQESLSILEEQISYFVSPTDIPGQLLKDLAMLQRKISGLKESLGI